MLKNAFWFLICCYLALGLLGGLCVAGFLIYITFLRS